MSEDFSGILLGELDVLYVNGCLAHLVAFVQSVENGNTQGESHSIGAIPMVGRAGMEPMVSFVRIGREHPASRQAQGGDVTVADYCFCCSASCFCDCSSCSSYSVSDSPVSAAGVIISVFTGTSAIFSSAG